tara:strand:+ start:289 stop:504 length:216 start_codon:yes stop_codon:yes gene_type:complete
MNPTQMIQDAEEAISQGQNMTMVVPRPFKNKPKGFPNGELLCEQPKSNVKSYDPKKVLVWMKSNGLYDGCV